MMKKSLLVGLILVGLMGSTSTMASSPYQQAMNQGQLSPQGQQDPMAYGVELHKEALEFMSRAQRGQLTPYERQMFQSIQRQANEMIHRMQNGQLTPQERQVFEKMQHQMRSPLSY